MAYELKSTQPALYTQAGVTPVNGNLGSLKGSHVSFQGYGISEGETVTFASLESYDKTPGSIKKVPTYAGSSRYSILVQVQRTKDGISKDSWFNMGILTRTKNEADGKSSPVDDFRANMIALDDDAARLAALAGRSIMGVSTIKAYRPCFERGKDAQGKPTFKVLRNEDGSVQTESADYVTVDYAE